MDHDLDAATAGLRALIIAGDQYRLQVATYFGMGLSDSFAISNLLVNGALTHGELARLVGVSTSGATVLVDRMQAAGIAQRVTDPDDRRRVLVELTPRGHAIMAQSSSRLQLAFADLDDDQIRVLTDLLGRLAVGLSRQAGELRDQLADGHLAGPG